MIDAQFDSYLMLLAGSPDLPPPVVLAEDHSSGRGDCSLIEFELSEGTAYFYNISTVDPFATGDWSVSISKIATPLPASLLLLGTGLTGLTAVRRRRH